MGGGGWGRLTVFAFGKSSFGGNSVYGTRRVLDRCVADGIIMVCNILLSRECLECLCHGVFALFV